MSDAFSTLSHLSVGGKRYAYYSLPRLTERIGGRPLPFSLKILLENLLRHQDEHAITRTQIDALAHWSPQTPSTTEITFMPARVVLQDFTGVPCLVDLAAMRDAVTRMGGHATRINPQIPCELVIDHSIQVDYSAHPEAQDRNSALEFQRNQERYQFLHWGQKAFTNFKVVPPQTGIVHQVNLEHLARVVIQTPFGDDSLLFPDTVFGTDSHTTMINGLGVLGWGVGGIEAEAAMLGEPSSMCIPQVVGVECLGQLSDTATATDLVLTITQQLRQLGVVGKFVEFFGDGIAQLSLADRATIANMAPEYGATCGFFPLDDESIRYLQLTGRDAEQIALIQAYAKAQGLWYEPTQPPPTYSTVLTIDLSTIGPSLAGPKRPQDRILLAEMPKLYRHAQQEAAKQRQISLTPLPSAPSSPPGIPPKTVSSAPWELRDGAVVIAAITSCTNTSNPSVMLGAGYLAQQARQRGLQVKPWVKTSLGPGSRVVTDYLRQAGFLPDLEALGFHVVGYGCTTCIGNSGPLPADVSSAIRQHGLTVAAVLSGNRNFEGRIHADVQLNYLAAPALVIAYAIAGTVDIDLTATPLGHDTTGHPVYLRDIWPSKPAIDALLARTITRQMYEKNYQHVFAGQALWHTITSPDHAQFHWQPQSSYLKEPPYFVHMTREPAPIKDLCQARILGLFGDSVTTDHISPAGSIDPQSPAAHYLHQMGVPTAQFNSYGSRRGHDAVMTRGTFANPRIQNHMLDGIQGGMTRYYAPDGQTTEVTSIYAAAQQYQRDAVSLVVIAGKEYGTGSSRDWAAKGPRLLGVQAVIAQSFERIHRANLVGMGILPLQFQPGDSWQTLGMDGSEQVTVTGIAQGQHPSAQVTLTNAHGHTRNFTVNVLLLTPKEQAYFRHGGVLPFVLRRLAAPQAASID